MRPPHNEAISIDGNEMKNQKSYLLIDSSGNLVQSQMRGEFGGHKGLKIYGRLDCSSAARWIAKGHYVRFRVFFSDEKTAISAGYRPCATCMPEKYKLWKEVNDKHEQ
jgi:hypothetical protein